MTDSTPAALAQHGVADGVAGRDVHVVELAGADLGDPGAVPGMLERAAPLANDDEGERAQAVGRRGRPGQSDAIAQDLGIEGGRRIGRSAFQSGQGVGQVGGDGQALAIKVRAAGGIGPLQRSAPVAASDSARRRPWASSDQAA